MTTSSAPSRLAAATTGPAPRRQVLVLYDDASVFINTVREHLEALRHYSQHDIYYANAVRGVPRDFELDLFDVVILHYSVRLAFPWHLSPAFAPALRAFHGPKLLFIQDEYDNTDLAVAAINDLRIDVVFSCVPPEYRTAFYAQVRPGVEFRHVLTGYVSPELEAWQDVPPLSARPIVIGYRGRELPYRYGLLGREKVLIAQRMREICRARNIPHDIEWTEDKRLYGPAWNRFLASCRATLGTESGSNIIDRDGSLDRAIQEARAANPHLTFEEAFERFLKPHEGQVRMNQVSPRIFEAIAARTALVLFEGTYSHVVQPNVHFIPLKKDFSNVEDVLRKVLDDDYLTALTERAYRDVIASGKYRYSVLVQQVDEVIAARTQGRPPRPPLVQKYPIAFVTQKEQRLQPIGLYNQPLDGQGFYFPPPEAQLPACSSPYPYWIVRLCLFLSKQKHQLLHRSKWFLINQGGRLAKWLDGVHLLLAQHLGRQLLHWLLRDREVRALGTALYRDLLRLRLIQQIRRQRWQAQLSFRLQICCDTQAQRLEWISLPRKEEDLPFVTWLPDRSPEELMPAHGWQEIVWDHRALGNQCVVRRGCLLVCYSLGNDGRYSFTALASLSRRAPALAQQLLYAALGQPAAPACLSACRAA